jgi:hypothetical protein
MPVNIRKTKLANAITSAANDHIVATSTDIYDETAGQYQSAINGQVTLNTMIFMTEEEYEAAKEAGQIDPTRLYAVYEEE